MVAGHGVDRRPESAEEPVGELVLRAPAPVGEVAARDDDVGRDVPEQRRERVLDGRVLLRPEMEVGDVEDSHGHPANPRRIDNCADG